MGIKSVMLTGDSRAAATRAQQQLGGVLEELHSELLPADKVGLVGDLKARVGPTLMVGDGMNDAPALAMADVGISMGLSGSAAAMETSHATLMSSNILRVPAAVALGRRTRATITANVLISMGAKAAVLALAVAWRPLCCGRPCWPTSAHASSSCCTACCCCGSRAAGGGVGSPRRAARWRGRWR